MTQAEIDGVCRALRELHPELLRPLSWHSVQRVLRRARVRYKRVPLDVPAMLLTHGGVSVILLNSELPPRSHAEAMAHEFAHICLHAGEPSELAFHIWRPGDVDPREAEADYLTRCFLAGPDADVEYRAPAKTKPPRETDRPRRPAPALSNFGLFDPYSLDAPPFGLAAPGCRDPQYYDPRRRARVREVKQTTRAVGSLRWSLDGSAYYTDADGYTWQLRDVHVTLDEWGRIRQTLVAPENERARVRYFVRVDDEMVRKYHFGHRELHDISVKHLERQLRQSAPVTRRHPESRENVG